MPKIRRGFFIALEGIDGCGKSTVLPLLAERLERSGHTVTVTHEPTDSKIGKEIYDILHNRHRILPPLELQRLYVEDRKGHITAVLQPALDAGHIVLCDRYWLSTLAYGMLAATLEELVAMHREILGNDFLRPDITFLFDLPPETAIARLAGMSRQLDSFEKPEKLVEIRKNYLALLNPPVDTISLINALQEPSKIIDELWTALAGKISRRR